MKKQFLFATALVILVMMGEINGQTYEWEIDKIHKRELGKTENLDSILVHLEKKWDIKISYGRWFFLNNEKSEEEELLVIPGNLGLWQLTGSWHFKEQLFTDFSIGFQLKRDIPATPDLFSIINGNDIEVEGGGVVFIPIHLGLKYYFSQNRFRPLLGISTGFILANSRYTLAEGSLSNGFSRTDFNTSDRVGIGQISTGFDYRLEKYFQLGMNLSYTFSGEFEESIGGYLSYRGILLSVGLALVL